LTGARAKAWCLLMQAEASLSLSLSRSLSACCDASSHYSITRPYVEGKIYSVGDASHRYTIQSACKPVLYGIAMRECGESAVHAKVGNEPSGKPFDDLSIDLNGKAYNPMVNAGAIITASMSPGHSDRARYDFFEAAVRQMSHKDTAACYLNQSVYSSEMATNARNQEIVDDLVKRKLVTADPAESLSAYTMACSLDIDTLDAAVIAATLANRGTNPTTKEEVLPEVITDQIINVMMSCGMYNGAGKWIVDVGVPAKSGVSGVIMGVVPGVCGFAVFSPCLDQHGNSTRGVLVAKELSNSLGLHVLKNKSAGQAGPRA